MNYLEKVAIIGSLGVVGGLTVYQIFKPTIIGPKLSKESIQKTRDNILNDKNMRILYSTMTFFYLQGFKQENLDSFFTLYDILKISQPKLVAIQLSEKEYEEQYTKILAHPQFPELMKKVEYNLKFKSTDLQQMKELDLKHLEKLYLIDYCKKNKAKIVFADMPSEDYEKLFNAKKRLQEMIKWGNYLWWAQLLSLLRETKADNIPDALKDVYKDEVQLNQLLNFTDQQLKDLIYKDQREEYFIQKLMDELKPKYSLLPSSPYKTILGLVDPPNLDSVSDKWKQHFKTVYGHIIQEDEQILEKRKLDWKEIIYKD